MAKVDASKLVAHLNQKWKGRTCPMCNSGPWNVQDTVFELREFNEGNLVVGGGPIIPLLAVTCGACGNTILVNALTTDLYAKGLGGAG